MVDGEWVREQPTPRQRHDEEIKRKASKVEPFSPSDDWDVPRPLTGAEQQRVASIITPPVEHRPDSRQVQIEVKRMRVRQAALEQFNAEQFRPDEIPAAISLAEMIHNPYRETPERIAGWLPKGGNGVLSSQAKAGKSTARNNLVRSVVDGAPGLGNTGLNLSTPARPSMSYRSKTGGD